MADDPIIRAMVDAERKEAARQTSEAQNDVVHFDHHRINRAALRAALEAAGAFATEDRPPRMAEDVCRDLVRAAYGRETGDAE